MKNIVYVLLGAIVVSFIVWVCLRKKKEDYKALPTVFLTKSQTAHFLLSDPDGFGKSLNKVNLEANGVVNHKDLIDKWTTSAAAWKPEEIQKLQDAAQIVDYNINTHLQDPFKSQLNDISWQFAKTIAPYYLDGLPHTRADIIFLTDRDIGLASVEKLSKILLHEKIHVWERKHPEEIGGWIERKGFKKIKRISEDGLQRQNPDIDDFIYEDAKGKICGVRFKNANPRDLHDIQSNYDSSCDHPYEQFAYGMERYIK